MISLGLLETNSIARGIIAGDAMLKAAEVTLLKAGAVCPGKYVVVIYGEVAAVSASMDAGKRYAAEYLVDDLTIASLDPQVVEAITGGCEPSVLSAMGVMEFYTISAAVVAADLAAKAADVRLMEVRLGLGIGGKSYVTLSGEVAAVQSAIDAGTVPSLKAGTLVSTCVIPSPRREIFEAMLS
ncbi:MAG TPA: BMC domain-containing protein [Clostridia bacterium]|jgi:microcompartment protein CcmL/EutN|nr:BMC domain-containing protein [Clostridia bacterium]HQO55055.1 BMC domain-containing protein [Clostridia bacterium]HUM59848.1 BMC domain-containing protein [Clostridia bacterium]